jgi:DUF4097 and DUF4098 domain-containing protein YvlB
MLSARAAGMVGIVVMVGSLFAIAETRQELHFKVGKKANISINNPYGPISVKAGAKREVVVTAVLHSNKVEIDQSHRGNRVDIVSHLLTGADQDNGLVEYEVLVPTDSNVTLSSMTGPLHVEKLHGDVVMEGNTASVDVRDVSDGHVHVKTLTGPVTLTDVRDGHVEITSLGGDVVLTSVSGPLVEVNSNSGRISYDGDFGAGGEYSLTSHTGDISAIAPGYASIDVVARSVQGLVENDFQLQPRHTSFPIKAGSAFAGTVGKAASSVKLFSFSGKIHLKKR